MGMISQLQGISLKASNANVITIGEPKTIQDQAISDRIQTYLTVRGHKPKTEFAASATGCLEAAEYVKSLIDLISYDEKLPQSRKEADVEYLMRIRKDAQRRALRSI